MKITTEKNVTGNFVHFLKKYLEMSVRLYYNQSVSLILQMDNSLFRNPLKVFASCTDLYAD